MTVEDLWIVHKHNLRIKSLSKYRRLLRRQLKSGDPATRAQAQKYLHQLLGRL